MPHEKLDIFASAYLREFNPEEPLFWQLRIPYAAFEELEQSVAATSHEEMMEHPAVALAYLAEWYKWRYTPGDSCTTRYFNPTGDEIRGLLESAGIDAQRWVARNPDTGRRSWMYSVYVLGGLPVAHELQRRGTAGRFLRRICRIYHGVNPEEELDDSGRAEAFRLSLQQGGSLQRFIRDTVSGIPTFADEDLNEESSLASRLIRRIVEANEAVLRDKFRLEWRISAPEGGSWFSRRLCLNLLPEVSGEGLRQYLMYDRVRMWGFAEPAPIRWLEFGVRFLKGNEVVDESLPFLSYTNNYHPDRGFLSMGVDRTATLREIPVDDFDRIEIYATSESGETHMVQSAGMERCIQLYATDQPDEWSDAPRPQKPTAVLWTAPWRPSAPIAEGLDDIRPFRSRLHGIGGRLYNLTRVPESLTLLDADGEATTYYDHQGTDQLTARRHDDVVKYVHGDRVTYLATDAEGIEEELLLPLLFTREDIVIRHTAADEFGLISEEILVPELLERKCGGSFVEWTDENSPCPGIVRVRATSRGRQMVKDFAYLGSSIVRDLKDHRIYLDSDPSTDLGRQPVMTDDVPVEPIQCISVGSIRIEVWQPIDCKEIIEGRHCLRRLQGEKRAVVPAMSLAELRVAIFSIEGYRSYPTAPLQSIHSIIGMKDKLGMLAHGDTLPARDLDPIAPEGVEVALAFMPEDPAGSRWLAWGYRTDTPPHEETYDYVPPRNSILFQDRSGDTDPLAIYCPKLNFTSFGFKALMQSVSRLECFLTASRYRAYYFLFSPLERMTEEEFEHEISMPLLEMHGGSLPKETNDELTRAAIELGYITIYDI